MSLLFNSPKVVGTEIDTFTSIESASNNVGVAAIVGDYVWGPNLTPTSTTSKDQFKFIFRPDSTISSLKANTLLEYTQNLLVVRCNGKTNAYSEMQSGDDNSAILINNQKEFELMSPKPFKCIAKYPGEFGNKLSVAIIAPNKNVYTVSSAFSINRGSKELTVDAITVNTGDKLNISGNSFTVATVVNNTTDVTVTLKEMYFGVDLSQELLDVDVTIRDSYKTDNYLVNVYLDDVLIESNAMASLTDLNSDFIYFGDNDPLGANDFTVIALGGGTTESSDSNTILGIDTLVDTEFQFKGIVGFSNTLLDNYLIQNVLEVKKYPIGFFSGPFDVDSVAESIDYRNTLITTSYGAYIEGWKRGFFSESNLYAYTPFSVDFAGCFINNFRNPKTQYKSPAGYVRGIVKNALGTNAVFSENDRDILWPNGINAVAKDNNTYIIFGDKTMALETSDYNRINVRSIMSDIRLKLINISNEFLFENNDVITQNRFKSVATTFLTRLLSDNAIDAFNVICDDTINTQAVKDSKTFKAIVSVRPKNAINYINIDFSTQL